MDNKRVAMLKGRATKILGIGLIVLSGVLWLALPGVPFLPVSNRWKGALAGAILVIAEIAFWAGCAVVGSGLIKKWKRALLSLFRKKNNISSDK